MDNSDSKTIYHLMDPYPFTTKDKTHDLEIHLYGGDMNDIEVPMMKIYFNTTFLLLCSQTSVDFFNDNTKKIDGLYIFPISINQFKASDLETGTQTLIRFLTYLITNKKITKQETNIFEILYLIDFFMMSTKIFDFNDVEFDAKTAFKLIHYSQIVNYPELVNKIDKIIESDEQLILDLMDTSFPTYPNIHSKIKKVVLDNNKLIKLIMTKYVNTPNNIGSMIGASMIDFFWSPKDSVIENFFMTRYQNNKNSKELRDIFSWFFKDKQVSGIFLSNIVIYLQKISVNPEVLYEIVAQVIKSNKIVITPLS
jgi:hypothetical protein